MKKIPSVKILFCACSIALALNVEALAQQPDVSKKVNFGYSQNPKTKAKTAPAEDKTETTPPNIETQMPTVENQTVEANTDSNSENSNFESRSIASKTLEVVKKAAKNSVPPTEIYKVGAGDVLFIGLQNAPSKVSTYFTVLNDGTIDYPLAGEMIQVSGLTTEEIEDLMREKIKLYENPQISVKVREHASHAVTVLGLVEKAGEKYLPREAVPLFMIRAEAIVQPKADTLVIKRASSETEQVDLKDSKSDEVLIFPGDILEFKASSSEAEISSNGKQFYYIGGNVVSAGQKDFHQGLTLTQAILASGGLRKATLKKVVVRRKNQAGLLSPIEFDLNSIKDGKQPDPLIQPGDTIELDN